MIDRTGGRLNPKWPRAVCLVTVLACLGILPVSLHPAMADDSGLVVVAEWPAPAGALPTIAFDGPARVGYLLSGPKDWTHIQALRSTTGRPLSSRVAIPAMRSDTPIVVDTRRHLLIYVERPPSTAGNEGLDPDVTASPHLVGVGLRGGVVRAIFRVPARMPGLSIVGLTFDGAGDDLLVLGSRIPSRSVGGTPDGASLVQVDRLSVDGLLRDALVPRWTEPYQLPEGLCPEVLSTRLPAGLLAAETTLHLACRPLDAQDSAASITIAQQAGVVRLAGITTDPAPPIQASFYPMPGKFDEVGESFAEPRTKRLVLVDGGTNGQRLRVFDAEHGRYVGTIKAAAGPPAGLTADHASGRVYVAGLTPGAFLGRADLAPLVPTQLTVAGSPFGSYLSDRGQERRLSFDATTNRLFVPHKFADGSLSLAVVQDHLPPYRSATAQDEDAGAIDAVDRPGITDSLHSATASAFGANYALLGGAGHLIRNGTGTDPGNQYKGTRSLRQAYVRKATLSDAASTVDAVLGTDDAGTDEDRASVGDASGGTVDVGREFAPPARCTDFGTSPTKDPVVVLTAQAYCDLGRSRTSAKVAFNAADGLVMTVPGTPGTIPLPVQVGRSSADVVQARDAGRGAVRTVVQARAENVAVLDVATIGSITSTVTVSAHGRRGTALAGQPKITITGLNVAGVPVCTLTCPTDQVLAALNTALGERGRVEFPQAAVTRIPKGTRAEVAQDPWYRAERILDHGQSAEDRTVPAMTITVFLEGTAASRLVVDFAAISATATYRVFPLSLVGPVPTFVPPLTETMPPLPLSPSETAPTATGNLTRPAVAQPAPAGGPLDTLVRAVRFALRSPLAALPLVLVWTLLGIAPYLAARRRLLLELPLLTREQELA